MLEKERKFLYSSNQQILDLLTKKKINIIQSYLLINDWFEIRIRKEKDINSDWNKKNIPRYRFTFKHKTPNPNIRFEIEFNINKWLWKKLGGLSKKSIIKIRHELHSFQDNVKIYVDKFNNFDLTLVEIEYKDDIRTLPSYCGMEVTNNPEYKNSNIYKRL